LFDDASASASITQDWNYSESEGIVIDPGFEKGNPKRNWIAEVHQITWSVEKNGGIRCLGVFICQEWLLLPASCLQEVSDHTIKPLEPTDIIVKSDNAQYKVLQIYRHPRFMLTHHGHDLAVISWERAQVLGTAQKTTTALLSEHSHNLRISLDGAISINGDPYK